MTPTKRGICFICLENVRGNLTLVTGSVNFALHLFVMFDLKSVIRFGKEKKRHSLESKLVPDNGAVSNST